MNAISRKEYIVKAISWGGLFLIVAELYLRMFFYKTPLMQQHPDLGLIPRKDSAFVFGEEGFGVTHFRDYGEIETPYEEGESVVVLGDSFTEGLAVFDEQKYVSVTETLLWKYNMKMDLHNLGRSAKNIADYVQYSSFIKTEFKPRLVIVQISRGDFEQSLDSSRENYFMQTESGIELVHQDVDYNIPLQNLIRSSSLVSFMVHRAGPFADEFVTNYILRLSRSEVPTEIPSSTPASTDSLYLNEQLDVLRKAYSDVDLVFVVIPNVPSRVGNAVSFNSPEEDLFVKNLRVLIPQDVLYPKEEFINLYLQQEKFPNGFSNTLPGEGHLNSVGHRILGEALALFLKDRLQ